MINMISLRSFLLNTTKGHAVRFVANKVTAVPDVIVQDAMQAGCVPADETDRPFIDDLSTARVEFTGNMRRSLIYLAMDVVARENNSKNFDGGGRPKPKVISDRLGFDVNAKENLAIWQEYMGAKSTGNEPGLHPQAEDAMEVLGAEDVAELRILAQQFGVSPETIEGLPTRDIRKLLLAKFSGISNEG